MSRGRQYIEFEGLFSESVLGIFRIIWSFADLRDLTGHRPNVYVEAGYALKHYESNRLIFLFEPSGAGDQVPFDLNTFKYVPITQAAEIPNRLKPELESILQSAGALLGGGAA